MKQQTFVNSIAGHAGKEVTLGGWVTTHRSSGKISFFELRDGTGFIQVVASHSQLSQGIIDLLAKLSLECAVVAKGLVTAHPKKSGVFEVQLSDLRIVGESPDYPIGKKEHGPDFLLENRHLWLRSKKQWAIQRIRNTIINATYEFLNRENFIKIDSPIITSNACEGTTTLFELEYFDLGKGYLSQSGQLYLEAAIAAHGRVFDFGPVFRAERSKTRKHLTEFWMMDAEMAFFEHADNMDLQERLISFMVSRVLELNQIELAIMERSIPALEAIRPPFERVTHKEIVKMLRNLGSEITEEMDLGANDETLLTNQFSKPLFIERWPAKIKAFYMKRDPNDPQIVLGSDLMATEGYGEMIGGSQREDSYDMLLERMQEEKMAIEPFQWFLDVRKYGSVPHAGFGFGLERLVSWISGAEHIRETIPFPRMIYRFTP